MRCSSVFLCVIPAACIFAGVRPAIADAGIYEGWDYPPGDSLDLTPGTGTGWAPSSGYSGPLAVVSPTLTHPAALPSTGNALATTANTSSINTSRAFAAPLDSTQTMWMSFLGRRDAEFGTYTVSLQQHSGNRTFSATFGVDVDPSTGTNRYKARWENVGFSVTSGDSFAPQPLSAPATTDLFLVRIDPADTVAGSQTFDMWVNPNLADLSSPDASITWPSSLRVWSSVLYNVSGSSVDELRIDSSLANVAPVPAPSAAGAGVALAMLILRRKRRADRGAQ